MTFTYKIAYNYSTVEFTIDGSELDACEKEISRAVSALRTLAMEDDGKGQKKPASGKKPVSDSQRRFLRVHGYKDAEIDAMDAQKAYKIISSIKEAEDDLY